VLPTKEMVYPSWGAGVIYAILYKLGGIAAVNFFHKFVFMIFVVLTGRELFKNGELRLRDLIIFGVLFFNAFFFLDRPAQIAIIPFFLLLKINLDPKRTFQFKLISSVLLTLFWINIHGSALIAPFLFYVLNTNKIDFKLLGSSFLIGIVLLINPFGWNVFVHAFESAILGKERLLSEWEPVASKSFPLQSILFVTTVGIIFNRFSSKLRKPPLWIFFLIMLGVTGVRQTVWLAYSLGFWFKGSGPENRKFALSNPVVLISLNFLAFFTLFPSGQKYLGANEMLSLNTQPPKTLVQQIEQTGEKGAIFNEFDYGSYFILKLPNKIFMDIRGVIYSDEVQEEYNSVLEAKETWQDVLDKYQISFVALPLSRNRIRAALASSGNWEIVFADKDYFLAKRVVR